MEGAGLLEDQVLVTRKGSAPSLSICSFVLHPRKMYNELGSQPEGRPCPRPPAAPV